MQPTPLILVILFIQADYDHRKLIIARFPLRYPAKDISSGDPVFCHGVSYMRRRIHTDPDTADLFQIIILCICKFSVQLFRQHPRSIEYPSGHNPVFLIELFLGFYINQKLYRLRPSPFGDICPESDVIGHGSFSRNLAFRIIPRDEEHFILLFSRSQRGIGNFNSRFDPRFYFFR